MGRLVGARGFEPPTPCAQGRERMKRRINLFVCCWSNIAIAQVMPEVKIQGVRPGDRYSESKARAVSGVPPTGGGVCLYLAAIVCSVAVPRMCPSGRNRRRRHGFPLERRRRNSLHFSPTQQFGVDSGLNPEAHRVGPPSITVSALSRDTYTCEGFCLFPS